MELAYHGKWNDVLRQLHFRLSLGGELCQILLYTNSVSECGLQLSVLDNFETGEHCVVCVLVYHNKILACVWFAILVGTSGWKVGSGRTLGLRRGKIEMTHKL